ncbi:sodium- and chloride-dependent betaine transporter-like [Styela clava]
METNTMLQKCDNNDVDDQKMEKINWKNKFEFIFNIIGYNVGLGNIWRFSYLCFKNGGGAFLIPYLLCGFFCGLPLLFMEVSIGQFTRQGCIGVWNLVPLMRGIGYGSTLLCIYTLIYFVYAMAWCIYYTVHSFTSEALPWATCGNSWNSDNCISSIRTNRSLKEMVENSSISNYNISLENSHLSTSEFWDNHVLQRSSGVHDMGGFSNWKMLGCFVSAWLMCYLCIAKGIRTSGKAAYVTVIVPYVLMFGLFIRGITLEGAGSGVMFYITPNMTRLIDPETWLDAGGQVLYSLGVCYGVLYGFGSYNKFNYDCYRSSYLFVGVCYGSSLFFGFVVFSFLGHMAHEQGKDIRNVVEGGPGLVFQVFPAEFALLPASQLWSALFFITLTGLAIDGSYATTEGCITAIQDYYREYFGSQRRLHYLRIGFCFGLMILGLPLLLNGGIYIFEILNLYGASGICILWLAMFETITIGWIYGVDRFYDDVKMMIGYYPPSFFKYCIKYISPTICAVIFVACCVKYTPLKMGNYIYPWWANMIGWFLSLSIVLCVPVYGMITMLQIKGTWKQKWRYSITSSYRPEIKDDEKDANEKESFSVI